MSAADGQARAKLSDRQYEAHRSMPWNKERQVKFRIFRHYVDTPVWIMALVEGLIFFGAVYAAAQLRYITGTSADVIELGPLFARALIVSLTMLTIMVSLGLYNADSKWGDWGYYSVYLASYFIGFITLTVIFYIFPELFLGRGVLGITLVVGFICVSALRLLFFGILSGTTGTRRVLVLGAGSRPAQIATLVESKKRNSNRFDLVGFVPTDGQTDVLVEKATVVPDNAPLLALARQNNVDEIVVGVRQRRGGQLNMHELLECRMEGINVVDLSTFFERETGKVQLESLNPSWIVFSEGFNRGNIRNTSKRTFDVIASLLLLIITLPVLLLTAVLVKLDSRGSIFYKQKRVGECGQVFDVLKFRSMRTDAEEEGKPQWALKHDTRVTRIGRIIRKLRIDELPQIFNVLSGEMSFVGPRPERPFFVNQLAKEIPYYAARHSVKPGITGWAQIRYPYGSSVEDAREKLQYDLYYAKNHTLFLDLIVLFETAQVILFGKGAR